jgi:signal peptide peptidase SppA
MRILELFNSPWAIYPQKLDEMIDTYGDHIKNDKIDFNALIDRQQAGNRELFTQVEDSAVIDVKGPLSKGSSLFSFFFDASSTKNIQLAIEAALENREINKIILDIDSPGGTVDGSFELADFINNAKREKPILAFSDGMIASAAYLIAASADSITITGKTNQVGSIGVIARHVDFTKMDESTGIKVTEFVTGKYKNLFSSDRALDDFATKEIQAQIDYIFSLFVADVSDRRPDLTIEQIVGMEAKVFIGQQSIEAGLVDSVSTMDSLINGSAPTFFNGVKTMSKLTLDQLKADNLELYNQIVEDSKKDGKTEGAASATVAERERVKAIQDAAAGLPGLEETARKMIASGASVEESMKAFLEVQKETLHKKDVELDADAPDPVGIKPPPEKEKKPDFDQLVSEHMKTYACKRTDAIKAIARENPEAHQAWIKDRNNR